MQLHNNRLLLCFLYLGLGLGFAVQFTASFKLPFAVNDVLPVLPRQVSWPVMNSFGKAVDLLPSFVGTVSPSNGSVRWTGSCFDGNEARMDFTEGDERGLGGGMIYLKVYLFDWLLVCLLI